MLKFIYEWIENIAFYMVIMVAVMQMIPGNAYKKYIKFFAGLILILMLAGPILNIFGMSNYQNEEYQKQLEEIERAAEYMDDVIAKEGVVGE